MFSYMRPHLTQTTALELLKWSRISQLTIAVDGIRLNASPEEASWRLETIKIIDKLALSDSRIKKLIYSTNLGLTNHSVRVQEHLFKSTNEIILLEEDNGISTAGLDFLSRQIKSASSPAVFTSYSSGIHGSSNLPSEARKTLFGQLWGNALNASASEALKKAWMDKVVNEEMVELTIHNWLQPKNLSERVMVKIISRYWKWYFHVGLNKPNHTDVALIYAMWASGGVIGAPWSSLSEDLSHLDFRGMNQRISPRDLSHHETDLIHRENLNLCKFCEFNDSRVSRGVVKSRLYGAKYKTLKRLGFPRVE